LNDSIRIATLFGIPIRLHWLFLPLLLIVAGEESLLLLFVLFGSVLLHELGHSLVARRFGIQVVDITFWPLGGMARMSEMPEDPKVEGLVAIAGPAVNFALALAALPLAVLFAGTGSAAAPFLSTFIGMNLLLGLFNLLPAFPMDGGRILRAFFARRSDWVDATERAVRVGRSIALFLIVLTLATAFTPFRSLFCMMPIIALFVWVAGGRELAVVRHRHGRSPFGGIGIFGGGEAGPAHAAHAAHAATAESSAPAAGRTPSAPEEPTVGRAQHPGVWQPSEPRPGRGFTDREIEEMERFPGRLPRRDET